MNKYKYEIEMVADCDEKERCNETVFHLANGYIGVRGCIEELGGVRGTYINGFYDIIDMPQAEPLFGFINKKQVMLNVLDTQVLKFIVDDKPLELDRDMIISHHMELNMREASSYRITKYRLSDTKVLTVEAKRVIPFNQKHIILMDYSFSLNFNCTLKVILGINTNVLNSFKEGDPRASSSAFKSMINQKAIKYRDTFILLSSTKNSKLEIAANQEVRSFDAIKEQNIENTVDLITSTITFDIEANINVNLNKRVYLIDSLRSTCVESDIEKLIETYKGVSSKTLMQEQTEYMDKFWDSVGLSIDGDKLLERAMNYNFFSLKMSSTQDEFSHLGAKGLSGEGYEGHYFWDTEMYVQLFFSLCDYEESKKLLDFRWRTLSLAKENALRMGHKKGALYPWRTINGVECSGYFPGGSSQYHINGAIAHAIIQYYEISGDKVFMINKGLIMLLEICRLFLDVGNFYDDKFMIHDVTGPDEYSAIVSNNYYTNICAKYDFEHLLSISKELDFEIENCEKSLINKAMLNMYLPFDKKLGISKQDDNFLEKPIWDFKNTPKENYPLLLHYHPLCLYRHQVCKQADVILAQCLYPQYSDEENRLNSLKYYEAITTHDSSLSRAIFSIAYAKLNKVDEALKYFGNSAYLDLENSQGNSGDGIHSANMGGTYMALILGFASFSIKDNHISISPILPKIWNSFSFNINFRSIRFSFKISHEAIIIRARGVHSIYIYDRKFSFENEGKYLIKKD